MTNAQTKKKKTRKNDAKPSSGKKAEKNSAKSVTPTEEKPKEKKKDRKLDESTAQETVKKAIAKKELKYIYPEDCKTGADKKAFRTKARAALKTWKKDIKKLEIAKAPASEIEAKQKEFRKWKRGIYTKQEDPAKA